VKLVLDLIGERESRIDVIKPGFLLEFIPLQNGAGMTSLLDQFQNAKLIPKFKFQI
jgi:hypothetical protein